MHAHALYIYLHIKNFPTIQILAQLDLVSGSYASDNLIRLVEHDGTSGCHVNPCYSTCGDSDMKAFKKII